MITTKTLDSLKSDFDLRIDYKYCSLLVGDFVFVGASANNDFLRLRDILLPRYRNFSYKTDDDFRGVSTNNENFDEIGSIVDYETVTLDDHPDRLKYRVKENYLLISSLKGAKCVPFLITDEWKNAVFSNGFYIYEVAKSYHPVFLKYLLQSSYFRNVLDEHLYRGIGISTFKERDFLDLRIPRVDIGRQTEIVEQVQPIEDEISSVIKSKKDVLETINEVLSLSLGFSLEAYRTQKLNHVQSASMSDLTKSFELRMSRKYHNPAYDEIEQILSKIGQKKLKSILAMAMRLGSGISPSSYDDDGEAIYVSMKAIKDRRFRPGVCGKVSADYWIANKQKSSIKVGDILIARSGEGTIGKAALIEEDLPAIFCDFIIRMRIQNYDPRFATFYFNSELFQSLIERQKKGLGNNTNIFPSQLREFPVPNISISRQSGIANEIEAEINKQNSRVEQILKKRQEIEKHVLAAIGIEVPTPA